MNLEQRAYWSGWAYTIAAEDIKRMTVGDELYVLGSELACLRCAYVHAGLIDYSPVWQSWFYCPATLILRRSV